MNLNQIYNKIINIKQPLELEHENAFDLKYLVYNGKLSVIADHFNKLSIEETIKLVNENKDDEFNCNRSCLQIAAFLGFQNIFLYLLTFDADIYHLDDKLQNICHLVSYKGENKILLILFNFLRFRLKMECLDSVENLKKTYNFSKLDVNRGKLSRAVNYTEANLKRFDTFQKKLREEAYNFIAKSLKVFQILFSQRDHEGRNPAHYAAMSKFSLCYLVMENFLEFDLFKNNGWEDFICLFEDLQKLEVKQERLMDPRRCMRLERELQNLLGENIINELASKFKNGKNEIVKNINNSGDKILDSVLHVAAFHGDYRIVNKLLIFHADKTLRNQDHKLSVDLAKDNYVRKVLTNLNKAAKNSDSKNITELVHFGHDINSKLSIFSQAPLHKIIESEKPDKYKVLKKMLDMGADPNIQDSNGWTPLHYSSELGDIEAVKILLSSKAIIDCYSNNKKTPLHFAASHNYGDIVKYILEKASAMNFQEINLGNKKYENKIADSNNPNPKTGNLNEIHPKTVSTELLGSEDNKKSGQFLKSQQNFYTIANSQSTRGFSVNVNSNNSSNNFSKTFNFKPSKSKTSVFSLDKNDLIYNKKDSSGCTPLHIAAKNGAVESLAILLAFGGDLYSEDLRKWNILHYAAFHGHGNAVKFISRYDSDFSILKSSRNSQNKLAIEIVRDHHIKLYFPNIWEAAKEGNLDQFRQLLNEGENINEKSTFLYNTPLHLAVFNNHYLMVRLILNNNGKIYIKNSDGVTVEEYSDLIENTLTRVYSKKLNENTDNFMNADVDWYEIMRNVLNINEKVLVSLISLKNKKVKLWKMIDFSKKINALLRGAVVDTDKINQSYSLTNNENAQRMTDSQISDNFQQSSQLIK